MPTAPDSTHDLIAAYLDGRSTAGQLDELSLALQEDPALRSEFIEISRLHADLSLGMDETIFDEPKLSIVPKGTDPPQPIVCSPDTAGAPPVSVKRPPRFRFIVKIAAIAALMVCAGLGTYLYQNRNHAQAVVSAPEEADSMAIVLSATNCRWQNPARPFDVGARIKSGAFVLDSGSATLGFPSGVRVLLNAPASIDIISEKRIRLHHGKLAARVSVEGRGFEVITASLNAVDLGTNFAVTAWKDGRSAIHVYEGIVEARPSNRSGFESLTANMTREVRRDSAQLEDAGYMAGTFSQPPAAALSGLEVGGDVHALDHPPASLRQGTYQHDFVLAFRESLRFRLLQPLDVISPTAGEFWLNKDIQKMGWGTLPAGTEVTAWFLNLDAIGEKHHDAAGSIRFPHPIVGLLATRRDLSATHPLLGSRSTDYGTGRDQVGVLEDDFIRISADRRTLTVKWSAARFSDSLRVLTEAGGM